jgi:KUP system potassium uptake protein
MIWALIVIVTVKYVFILLNADNKGEGGTLSLMALVRRGIGSGGLFALSLGLIGTAVDATFLAANLLKVVSGGWVPLFIGAMLIVVMVTFCISTRLGTSLFSGLETSIPSRSDCR